MQTARTKKIVTTFLLTPALLLATFPAVAQYPSQRQDNRNQYQQQQAPPDRRVNQNYYSGMRDGGRGGNYDRAPTASYTENDTQYHQPGGVGPGKGAAIGAGAGALLGALFGGGLKGVVIGGAVGAGVGAAAGQANQNSRNDHRTDSRRDNY